MRYFDRRLLFPVAAVTAFAQQPSPEAAAAEAALRARAEQFFQLQVDKRYRQAESLVAEDSKEDYYNGSKFNIKGFSVERVELLDGNTQGLVTIKARVTLAIPGAAKVIELDAPSTTMWKLEDGRWMYHIDANAATETPFGKINSQSGATSSAPYPSLAGKVQDIVDLQNQVKADRQSVILTASEPRQTIVVTNYLPGAVDISVGLERTDGFTIDIERRHLNAGQATKILFSAIDTSSRKVVVPLLVSPLNIEIDIQVAQR